MAGDYLPYVPQGEPVLIDEGIWTVEGPTVLYPFGPFRIPCPTRATILADPRGGIWLHSPVAYSDQLRSSIEALGPISGLIAPNTFHHLYIRDWAGNVPRAAVVLAPGLEALFEDLQSRSIPLTRMRSEGGPDWLGMNIVDGTEWREVALFHKTSRSLILTDMLQNFELGRVHGLLPKSLLALSGAGRGPVVSIELLATAWRSGMLDQVRASLRMLKGLSARRVLIAHGKQPEPRDLRKKGWAIED
ncbi:hypothetical protein Ga0102493_111331 [Erythrobacter litoralis]|uniref:DUF4336 domain-containing protein n=1 Tax=Erythrobacter litoralis TaxID=39960 RepID=A0A074M4Q2_9SPHN|nr:DUF4336 domain-containing protein [Erythrobacter litoralis]AOL22358.1 hypothetical protein Ga0102493_111331 [Erythrobacter litoralis]KEO89646.1 hypothetical protein EH32_03850 [Erythrobacter litoralis]